MTTGTKPSSVGTPFDCLPLEILRRVASHSTASSVFNLSATSKRVRCACWDPFVLQDLIENNKSLWPCGTFNLDSIRKRIGPTNTRLWAQFALADQKAAELRGGLDGEFRGNHFEKSLDWAPHLIILNR